MLYLVESSVNAMHIHIHPFAQTTALQFRKLGRRLSQPAKVSKVYVERAAAMADALWRELAGAIEFTEPAGGLFLWARLTGAGGKVKDASEFAKRVIEKGYPV